MLEIHIFITLWITVLYYNNYPYYPNRNKGIELFVVSIITIVTGIYNSRWRVFSRSRHTAIARIYNPIRDLYYLEIRIQRCNWIRWDWKKYLLKTSDTCVRNLVKVLTNVLQEEDLKVKLTRLSNFPCRRVLSSCDKTETLITSRLNGNFNYRNNTELLFPK